MEKHVLGLELPTDPRWVHIAEKNVSEILTDHAYCEQKAATSCISLIVQFFDKEKLVEMLTPVVSEEWDHFSRVLVELKKRNLTLGRPRRDEYVDELQKLIKKGGDREQQLVEKLLLNALIEARSCERFRLLWKEIKDTDLSNFYYDLMVSEAGHYKNFLALAKEYHDSQAVHERWHELLSLEAEIMRNMQVRGDRMH
jgi:tRNA-(ms[2]io[6]A)-hydroxylase